MRILFVLRHAQYLRNFEAPLRELARRGHDLCLAFTPLASAKAIDFSLADRLSAEHATISLDYLPQRVGPWVTAADSLRAAIDYLRYLEPRYASASALRARARRRVSLPIRLLVALAAMGGEPGRRWIGRRLRSLEARIPVEPTCLEALRRLRPDVVVVSPLIDMTYEQLDYLKAARALRLPTVLCVASWDNLSNKGLVQIPPDRTIVWNEIQRREAADLHGLNPDTVVVTGAQIYDQWFAAKPQTTREDFCRRHGFAANRPILLYVCSSSFIAPHEQTFVAQWIKALRGHADPFLSGCNVLVRPHPDNARLWRDMDFSRFGGVAIWPRAGEQPVDEASKANYFDSLFHSAAVVGINTSALLEAAILDRPCLTIETPEYRNSQAGTIHFHYLVDEGLLSCATTLAGHLEQLGRALDGDSEQSARRRQFVRSFLRPHGLEREATPFVVAAIEGAGQALRPAVVEEAPAEGHAPSRSVRALAALIALAGAPGRFLDRSLRRLQGRLRSNPWFQYHVVGRIAPVPDVSPTFAWQQIASSYLASRDSLRELERIADSGKPILVGPWLGESELELLYWIPFLRWAVERYKIPRERFCVVSRGGVSDWYGSLSNSYADVFRLFSDAELRFANPPWARPMEVEEELGISAFDAAVVERLVERGHVAASHAWLHPRLMRQFFQGFWRGHVPVSFVERHVRYAPIIPTGRGACDGLPKRYAAVRFDFGDAFRDSPDALALGQAVVERLARHIPVVALVGDAGPNGRSPTSEVFAASNNVVVKDGFSRAESLGRQTEIIAGAEIFVGSLGGCSYLAPMLGVASLAYFTNLEGSAGNHALLATSAFHKGRFGSLTMASIRDADRLRDLLI